jgi:hypothetical protein
MVTSGRNEGWREGYAFALSKVEVDKVRARCWDEGYIAGHAFGYEYAQDTYDGPGEDPTPNPYREEE